MTFMDLATMSSTAPKGPTVLCLGDFDGVHRGHQRLIEETKAVKQALAHVYPDVRCGAWFFTDSPKSGARLTTAREKCRLFAEMGLDLAVTADFDDMKGLSPMAFVKDVLQRECGCVWAVCGFNFRFGQGAVGQPQDLCDLFDSKASVVPPVCHNGEPISSTAIRECLREGDVETATALLGHPFSLTAPITHGNHIGHTIGIPTINQGFPQGKLLPARGIYASCIQVNGQTLFGVSNVGTKPTVNTGDAVNCETHILDFDGDLYGLIATVSFLHRLRNEQKFDTLSDLQQQIERDIRRAKALFAQSN